MVLLIASSLILFAVCIGAYKEASEECDRIVEEEISSGRYDFNLN